MKRMIEGNMHLYDINVNYSCYEKKYKAYSEEGIHRICRKCQGSSDSGDVVVSTR